MKRKAKRTDSRQSIEVWRPCENPTLIHDGMGTTMPPDKRVLQIYFDQKGEAALAEMFFNEHDNRNWKTPTGGTIYNWKVCATEWIYNYRQEIKRRFRRSPFYSESI